MIHAKQTTLCRTMYPSCLSFRVFGFEIGFRRRPAAAAHRPIR